LVAGVVVGRLARGTKDAIEAAEGTPGTPDVGSPRVTPGAPDTTAVNASHGQPTQSLTGSDAASATGYSSPPIGTGLPSTPTGGPQGGTV
jgi:hypothetical protein